MKLAEVNVLFYSDKRKSLPCPFDYRPHFVIDGNYLGVQFAECDLTEFDKFGTAIVKLVYDGVDYSPLTENAIFDIVEGSTVVGKGFVCETVDIASIYKLGLQINLPIELRNSNDLGFDPNVNYSVITGQSKIGNMMLYQEDGFTEFVFSIEYERIKKFSKKKIKDGTHWHPHTYLEAINDMIAFMTNDKGYFEKNGFSFIVKLFN